MDYKKFNETEQKYRILKGQLNNGEITPEELKNELKGMMIQDEEGIYWMIGGKTGKWYIYDGTDWKEENPYKEEEIIDASGEEIPIMDTYTEPEETSTEAEQMEDKVEEVESQEGSLDEKDDAVERGQSLEQEVREEASIDEGSEERDPIAIDLGQDQTIEESPDDATRVLSSQEESREEIDESKPLLEKEIRTTPTEIECRICSSRIPAFSVFCQICGTNQKTPAVDLKKEVKPAKKEDELLVTSVNIISMIFFLGGLGIIIGVLLGATFGSIKDFFMNHGLPIPAILEDTRGGIAGGLIFACIGGIGGFIIFALASVIISSFCNLIAFIFGGIRFKIKT